MMNKKRLKKVNNHNLIQNMVFDGIYRSTKYVRTSMTIAVRHLT